MDGETVIQKTGLAFPEDSEVVAAVKSRLG
jgi:hypothetical protein